MIYGYCRISTKKQSIERQIRNILSSYPDAFIVKEIYTGTKLDTRKEFKKILNKIRKNDLIVFDSVSRMSRNAEEGYKLYQELYNKGINLVFLKEPYINTETYRNSLKNVIDTDTEDNSIKILLNGINLFLQELAKKQIYQAFEQSEKEVLDLRLRTKEGLNSARLNGKHLGRFKGMKVQTKKSVENKKKIKKLAKDFGGNLKDKEVIEILGITRNTYYKYKKEILKEEVVEI